LVSFSVRCFIAIPRLSPTVKTLTEETFATLGLFVIYNNTIEDDMLSRKSPLKTTLEEMSGEFNMPYTFSPRIVKEQL
jgi:hypothetical protein